jgi:putative peptide zinc metalloprotease protein
VRIGPSSLHATSVIAKGYQHPKFRTDLKVSRQEITGEVAYIVKIPETESYARYGELEFDLLSLADGTRTPAEIAEALVEKHPDSSVDEGDVLEFLDNSDRGLWERSPAERNLALLAKIRDERKGYVGQSSALYMPVTSWDPDKVLDWLHPYVKWMFTRGFVIFSIFLFIVAAAIIGGDYNRISRDTTAFYSFTNKSFYDIWTFWLVLFLISGIHEFGHGMACKHFGGEVHHMGFLLIYFTPAFYTDTTDQYLFPSVAQREWVIFAGIWVELVSCGLATIAWHLLPPGTLWSDLAYKIILLSALTGVLFNLNPLMKFDGYYALAQYLRMDNLREDAFAYARAWLGRNVLLQDVELPAASRRQRRIYMLFAPAAFLYSMMVLVIVTLFVKNVSVNHFGDWGYVLTLGVVYLMLRKRLIHLLPALDRMRIRAREHLLGWNMTRMQKATFLAMAGLIVLVPLPTTISSNFMLEPIRRDEIRPPAPGVVHEVLVRTGEKVTEGQAVARLASPTLEAAQTRDESRLADVRRELVAAESSGDQARIGQAEQQSRQVGAQLADVQTKLAGLDLRAAIAGVVTTPEVDQKTGLYLHEGETFAVVADVEQLKARLLVIDRDLQYVRPGSEVKLKLNAYPFHTFTGRVAEIMPAAAAARPIDEQLRPERYGQDLTNYFSVIVTLPNPQGVLREGMTGEAKIYAPARPLVWQMGRGLWRWAHSIMWW